MTAPKKPIDVHYQSAREHLAGLKAAAKWREDLIAAHLLDSQTPIKSQPFPAETPPTS